jgi:hypothetical protein
MPRGGTGSGAIWIGLVAAGLGGCAASNTATVGSAAAAAPPTVAVVSSAAKASDQSGPPRESAHDDRFSSERQITELRRAIALYEQFIARAESDPRFEAAVQRSRARVADARATIDFLLLVDAETSAAR